MKSSQSVVSSELNIRLEKWRKKLLDLSLKNPLLSMRNNVGLSVWYPSPSELFSILSDASSSKVVSNTESLMGCEFVALPISEEGGIFRAIQKVYPDTWRDYISAEMIVKHNSQKRVIQTQGEKNDNSEYGKVLRFDEKPIVDLTQSSAPLNSPQVFTQTSETHAKANRMRLSADSMSPDDAEMLKTFVMRHKKINPSSNHLIVVDSTSQQLSDQLVRLNRTNRQKEDESGVHVLFLALGSVHWMDGKSSKTSPLLLVPVSLRRDHSTDPFVLVRHDDEMAFNPVLMHMFTQQHAIEWSEVENVLAQDKVDYKSLVKVAQDTLNGLADIKMNTRLSLFSYAKHHMWNDLSARTYALEKHPVVQKIVGVTRPSMEQLFPSIPLELLDKKCTPDTLLLPLAADSSQIQAIARVNQGESLVIQGPPGTGKSQTITNLIANLLAQGKRVLFVAEKLTALSVVHQRLEQLGLGAFCLELHTQSNSKQYVLTQLQEALAVRNTPIVQGYKEAALHLQNTRLALNESLDALHREYPNGLSIYRAIGRLAQAPNAFIIPGLVFPNILEERAEDVLRRKNTAVKYAQALRIKTPESKVFDVWRNIPLADDKQLWEVFSTITTHINQIKQWCRQWPAVQSSHFETHFSVNRLHQWYKLAAIWMQTEVPLLWKKAAWKTSFEEDFTAFKKADREWSAQWSAYSKHFKRSAINHWDVWSEYLNISKKWGVSRWLSEKTWNKNAQQYFIRPTDPVLLKQFAEAVPDLKELFETVDLAAKKLMSHLPKDRVWDPSVADFSQRIKWFEQTYNWIQKINELTENDSHLQHTVSQAVVKEDYLVPRTWVENERFHELNNTSFLLLNEINGVEDLLKSRWSSDPVYAWEDVSIWDVEKTVAQWMAVHSSWSSWRACEKYRAEALSEKLTAVVDVLENGICSLDDIEQSMDCTYAKLFVNSARMEHPEWVSLQGAQREHAIKQFIEESDKFDKLTQKHVVACMAARLRNHPIDEWVDMAVFKRETMKKVRHLPTRKLIRKLPKLLPVLKPCLMMSPVSVAEYLSNEVDDFDVVIFDEASQITTADAIGAVSRAKQVVVVGDPKQMPPSRMFSVDDDDDTEEGDLDSILTECLGSGMKSVLLNWHYRSRNERLISFSNKTYYGGELITFPTADPLRSDQGLVVHDINGIYDRGGSGTNTDEAKAVVAHLEHHVLNPKCSQSIGVVTFNQKQQQLIEGLWDRALTANPLLEQACEKLSQPITIKNLESVQGDERDVILFSTTFGKDADGRFMLNFGPLGQVGGERRLNVAITRARDKMEIFSSFHPNEIDPSRVTHQGVRDLREWLLFARGGNLNVGLSESLGLPDSPFELAVLNGLTARGWIVQPQVGCSGYRIDIAVVDPRNKNYYLAGVECDGATYHSFKAARDRDKQRQSILEGLNWNIVRVWSTDFFENSARELDRVSNALKKLTEN